MSVIVGDQTGLVKVVSVGSLAPRKLKSGQLTYGNTSTSKIAAKFGSQARGQGVAKLCWAGVRHREEQFAVLRDSGVVEVWSPGENPDVAVINYMHPFEPPVPKPDPVPSDAPLTKKQQVTAKVKLPPPSPPRMIGLHAMGSANRRILTASADGVVCVSRLGEAVSQHVFKVGPDMWGFDLSPNEHKHCAVGGKEQLLRMWDLETHQCSWKARNLPNDWLNLQVPEWIRAIRYRPQNPSHIFTATAYHKLRMYDVNAGKRPVLDFCPSERALLTLSTTPDPNYVIAADSTGSMMLLDVRKGQLLGAYRGSGGALRDIVHHPDPSMPVVASVGLDRFLKIHHSITRRLIKRIYLKQKMNCALFSAELPTDEQDGDTDVWGELDRRGKAAQDEAKGQSEAQPAEGEEEEGEGDEGDQGGDNEENEDREDDGEDEEEDEEGEGDEEEGAEEFFKQSTASVSFAGLGNAAPKNTKSAAPKSTKRKR